MRVLLVNTYYDPEMVGGAEHSVKKLAEQLAGMHVECGVLCTGDMDEDLVHNGVRIFRRRMKKRNRSIDIGGKSRREKMIHRVQELGCLQNLPVINGILDTFRPDVIHTNGLYDITPVIWPAARRRGIRVVHTIRDYYLICPRVQLMRRGSTQCCRNPLIVCRAYRALNRWYSGFVDVVTAPSRFALTTVLDEDLFRGCRSEVVYNAVEAKCEELHAEEDCFTVLYLGELTKKKGVEWLLDAFEKCHESHFRLRIAGKGELVDVVREHAKADPRIEYLGQLNAQGVDEALNHAGVLVCPSLWEEPFGRVVIDAYSHTVPVIASDRGALPEIVADGETGMVIPAGDVLRLAEALRKYDGDRKLRRKHAENAIKAMEQFLPDRQAMRFMEIYQEEKEESSL